MITWTRGVFWPFQGDSTIFTYVFVHFLSFVPNIFLFTSCCIKMFNIYFKESISEWYNKRSAYILVIFLLAMWSWERERGRVPRSTEDSPFPGDLSDFGKQNRCNFSLIVLNQIRSSENNLSFGFPFQSTFLL